MNGRHLNRFNFRSSYFFYSILLISLAYALFEYIYIPYWSIAVDEFVFARQIYDYTFRLPYADFPPYKGVLGYYLLSIPMYFSHTLLDPIFYIKDEVALINAIFIILASYWAARLFDKRAVLLTVLLIITNQLFLIYAADLRVDMLASWGCLFAALSLLQHRLRLAGVLLGIAFLISQKALWYFIAMNGAMALCWILFSASRYSFRSLLTFNLAIAAPIVIYVIAWSFTSSFSTVLYSLFYEAYIQAGIDWYMDIYLTAWMFAFTHGALLFFLWPLTFLSLSEKKIDSNTLERRVLIISFASIALILFINYKQPFHYNFLLTIPAFFLLYADFISWLFIEKNKSAEQFQTPLPSLFFIFAIACYVFSLCFLIPIFSLPIINYLLAAFPIFACFFLYSWNKKSFFHTLNYLVMLIIFIGMGIVYPLFSSLMTSHNMNGNYQQTMIKLTSELTKEEGDYLGGVPYLYQKDQPIEGMKNLISPAIGYLSMPSEKLKLLLLPSLFIAPTTQEKILNDFENTSVKVIIANYRIRALPPKISDYIKHNYQHFYGSLYLYAPEIKPSQLTFNLKFSSRYRIEAKKNSPIVIDGKRVRNGQVVQLKKGDHLSDAVHPYRLALIPAINPSQLDPAYRNDRWDEKN